MMARRALIYLLSVYLLFLMPGDTSAIARQPTPLTRCTGGRVISPTDVKLELFDKNQLNQANPPHSGTILKCNSARVSTSSSGGSVLSGIPRPSSARGSTSSRGGSARGSTSSRGGSATVQGPTAVVMHGFKSSGQKMKAKGFIEAYRRKDANLIIVDWSGLASSGVRNLNDLAGYKKAAACAIEVGRYLAECLNGLKVDPSSLHLIGHSLGAHGVGMAGRELAKLGRKIKPSRVTGMDPAGPGFISPKDVSFFDITAPKQFVLKTIPYLKDLERISKGSGDFVDIVHTNIGMFGYAEQLGHVDYYVNGGGPIQEECNKKEIKKWSPLSNGDTRSHEYALNVVVASLKSVDQNIEPCVINGRICNKKGSVLSGTGQRGSIRSQGNFEVGTKPIFHGSATYELTTGISCQ